MEHDKFVGLIPAVQVQVTLSGPPADSWVARVYDDNSTKVRNGRGSLPSKLDVFPYG